MQKDSVRRSLPFLVILSLASLSSCLSAHRPLETMVGGGYFAVKLWASTACADRDETVTLRATVTNTDSQTHSVELKDQPVLDMIVESHSEVRRWSEGKALGSNLTRLELKPNESKSIEMKWVAKTEFVVSASLIYDARLINDPAKLSFLVYVDNCPGVFGP
jgi:hypothetical protein